MMVADVGLAALSGINSMTRFPLYLQCLAAIALERHQKL
jgi:hypothetical protein